MSDDDDGYRPMPEIETERLLKGVVEVDKISQKLDSEDVTQTLAMVIKLVARPDVPASVAIPMITKLQALSFQFKLQAKYYMLVGKGDEDASLKKNLYMSLAEETEKLVQALKYTTRTY